MRMIGLVARQALTYRNRTVGAGERFEAAPIDAAVLTYRRQAVFAPRGAQPAPPAPVSQPTPGSPATEAEETEKHKRSPAKRRGRRYQRRDMVAEED